MSSPHSTRRARLTAVSATGALALTGALVAGSPATAATPSCDTRTNNTVAKLLECVSADGVMDHLEAFQGIADTHGGTRASGTPGYDASADYVQQRLEAAGYEVTRQEFQFPYYQVLSEPTLSSADRTFVYGTDFRDMTYSGSGDVVDATASAPPVGPLGCDAADFAGFRAGDVAVIRRGTCSFAVKAQNAEEAGAAGVVVYNNVPGLLNGTLGAPGVTIPVVGTTPELGPALLGTEVDLSTDTVSELRMTENVFAELPGRTSDNVVMAGAHLDSVAAGPGINDNGSGSAAILEVAESMRKVEPENTVRFAWWGAEELGLLGSNRYVADLAQAERDRIALYLNFDMVGSPNFARFIYDGDLSAYPAPAGVTVPAGSDQIEYVFEDFYERRALHYEGTQFSGRSDYQAFIGAGIPSGGLFTGAEGVKTAAQAAAYGGTAGQAYDPNYHQVGDTIDNVDPVVLGQNSDAVAYSVLTLAWTTERVNGDVGTPVPGGTFEEDPEDRQYRVPAGKEPGGSGGLDPEHDHDHGGETA